MSSGPRGKNGIGQGVAGPPCWKLRIIGHEEAYILEALVFFPEFRWKHRLTRRTRPISNNCKAWLLFRKLRGKPNHAGFQYPERNSNQYMRRAIHLAIDGPHLNITGPPVDAVDLGLELHARVQAAGDDFTRGW